MDNAEQATVATSELESATSEFDGVPVEDGVDEAADERDGAMDNLLDTLETIRRLVMVLDHETTAVMAMDIAAAALLQDEKIALTDAYAVQMRSLGACRDVLAAFEDEALAPLAEAHTKLTEALRLNLRALENGRQATQRVVETIGQAVREASSGNHGYGRRGTLAPPPAGRCVAVSLDGKI